MNELQRQHYLSALGVDTYMPRWQLPFAPVSVACEMISVVDVHVVASATVNEDNSKRMQQKLSASEIKSEAASSEQFNSPAQSNNLLTDILDSKKTPISKPRPVNAVDILAQLDTKPASIEAFSLSVWRPLDEIMIIDSRNSKLALPTELLLNNILRSIFQNESLNTQEEILRWPMIENSFAKRTANDARAELQTWLSVQHEIRPVKYLWLMGSNAAIYFLNEQTNFTDSIFQSTNLVDSEVNALVMPSLNEILQSPILKKKIFAALQQYHSKNL
jgi:hypothetical protein